ncbi:MAG: phage integrase N-terminal SAM-like domain-containing protein [Thiohalocapsa sp.]
MRGNTDVPETGSQPEIDNAQSGKSWVEVYENLETAIKVRHYSPKTLKSYRSWARKFQGLTRSKAPGALSVEDVKRFLSFLAVKQQVAASTQNQAFNSLLFLFRHVLQKEFGRVEGVVRAKQRPYIPVVLSRQEVDALFDCLDAPYHLVAKLLYGCGLRLFECLQLRVQDINLELMVIRVHDGKGKKDRMIPFPQALRTELPEGLVPVLLRAERGPESAQRARRQYRQCDAVHGARAPGAISQHPEPDRRQDPRHRVDRHQGHR